jgi:hypothetical protein
VKHKKPPSKLIETIERKSISKRKLKGLLTQISLEDPSIIQETLPKVEASHWKKAINEKLKSLQKNNIGNLTIFTSKSKCSKLQVDILGQV